MARTPGQQGGAHWLSCRGRVGPRRQTPRSHLRIPCHTRHTWCRRRSDGCASCVLKRHPAPCLPASGQSQTRRRHPFRFAGERNPFLPQVHLAHSPARTTPCLGLQQITVRPPPSTRVGRHGQPAHQARQLDEVHAHRRPPVASSHDQDLVQRRVLTAVQPVARQPATASRNACPRYRGVTQVLSPAVIGSSPVITVGENFAYEVLGAVEQRQRGPGEVVRGR